MTVLVRESDITVRPESGVAPAPADCCMSRFTMAAMSLAIAYCRAITSRLPVAGLSSDAMILPRRNRLSA